MKKLTTEEFDLLKGKVVVVFGATWCAPCKALKPILETLSADYTFPFVEIDVDKSSDLACRYAVRGVPTVIIRNNTTNIEFDRLVGNKSGSDLKRVLDKFSVIE